MALRVRRHAHRPPSRRWRPAVWVVGVCAATAAGLLPGCTDARSGTAAREQVPSPRATAPAPVAAEDLEDTHQEVVQDVLPSVVQITTDTGLGSGVVYDEAGHIVTNAHVVGDATRFEVLLATGQRPFPARLVATHPEQDLALVRLTRRPEQLRPVTFGDSSAVAVGQHCLAMGNPLGLSSSVTQGIVSAVGRSVSQGAGLPALGNMIQTSAAINPGNSGGALVDLSGHVIGIPTLAARDPQLGAQAAGIGFAIPANTVTFLAEQMIEHGRVVDSGRAALGVRVRTVLGEGFEPAGAAIVEVTRNGPAERAGLRPGDVLVRLGGEPVTDVVSLSEALAAHRPDQKVTVVYQRDRERRTTTVTLGEA